jgi:hypothetical protein
MWTVLLLGKAIKEHRVFSTISWYVAQLIKIGTWKLVYIIHFHALMSYGAILQGNSTDRNTILKTQKKIIRIMAGVKKVALLWYYLGGLIYLCLQNVVLCWGYCLFCAKLENFLRNSDVHSLGTWHGYMHMPHPNFHEYQKRVYYASIMLISNIPCRVHSLNNNVKAFKLTLIVIPLYHFRFVDEFTAIENPSTI